MTDDEAVSAALQAVRLYAIATGRGKFETAACTISNRNVWRGTVTVDVTLGRTWGHKTMQLYSCVVDVTGDGSASIISEHLTTEPTGPVHRGN